MADLSIGGKTYNRRRVLVIAELGSSHGGDLSRARRLTDAAAEAGADCIKFQIIHADEILHPNTGELTLPGGRIRLYDRFKELEVEPDFYARLKEHVESLGLLFLCTPFGPGSASELRALGPCLVKIASPELNYTGILREIASWQVPVLLSTGVSRLGDIENAVEIMKEGGAPRICLLHCVTAYPAPERDYNLRLLPNLASIFGVSVGVSDHSRDPELVPALSVAMGAAAVEKHFCLSRDDPGLDDPIALPPEAFARMAGAVRRASAEESGETVEAYRRNRGVALVDAVLGTGIKELAPSERENYRRTNRSIHALRDIAEGEIIEPGMFAVLRTEKILRPGLCPSMERVILGRRAGQFIPSGEGIRFEDL
ncbi:MAG: N-acetylneuraminate synthase family protein [Treponema sp.]|jgi:sialic acid synthase SpsE|nr:N-acetylneuraminate synthase family protein [Treponema sp.]